MLDCSGCGGIGRRARLRIWFLREYGFESLHPHLVTQPDFAHLDIQFEPIAQTVVAYRLTVEPSDYQKTYKQRINELRKSAQLPGFRLGQVPASLIEKKYGEKLLVETVIELCSVWLTEYIEDFKIRGLRSPELKIATGLQLAENPSGIIELEFRQIVCPNLDIEIENLPRFARYKIELTDSDVESEVRSLRAHFGSARETLTANLLDQFYQYHLELFPVDSFGNPLDERTPLVAEFMRQVKEQGTNLEDESTPMTDLTTVKARYLSWMGGQLNSQLFGKSVNDQWRTNWSDMLAGTNNIPFLDESVPDTLRNIFQTHDFIVRVVRIDEITPHTIDEELHQAIFRDKPYQGPEQFLSDYRSLLEEQVAQMPVDHLNRQLFTYLSQKYPVQVHSDELIKSFLNEIRTNVKDYETKDQTWYHVHYDRFLTSLLNEIYHIELVRALGDQLDLSEQAFEAYLYDYFQNIISELTDEQYQLLPTTEEEGEVVIDLDRIIAASMKDQRFRAERLQHFRHSALNSCLWESGLIDTELTSITLEAFRKVSAMPLTYAT